MPTGHQRGTTPLLAGLAVLGVAAALFTAAWLIDPPPSRTLVIATASASSGYQEYAERYRNILAQQGVRLGIRPSLGSADNLNLLRDKSSGVQAAFSTIGAARLEDATEIVSLGGVFVTPVFVFYRSDETITRFAQFRGKRLAIEIAGTTLHDFTLKIMRDAGALDSSTRLTELSSTDAVQALADGRIDAAIISSADVKGPAVEMALALPGLRIMNVSEADAIAVNVPALRHIVMPRAMLSLATDQPPAALDMLGLGNALLVRKDVHPALQLLMLETARQVHGGAGPFQRFGEFPAPQAQDLPLSDTAERFYRSGPPFLQQYMSVWMAELLERLAIVLIPLVAVLIPLSRYVVPAYNWFNGRRIWRWHRALADLERDAAGGDIAVRRSEIRTRLAEAETAIDSIRVPTPLEGELYHLRHRLRGLREHLES
ncbi:MAG: TAXI family TRAP transporter solute-binding subunit [Xanthobacteraceae bacterium]